MESTQPATAALHPRSAHPSASTQTYEVTPEGLTTAVNVPLEISEAELAQSCIDVRPTLMTFGGDVDAVLAMIQGNCRQIVEERHTTGTGSNYRGTARGSRRWMLSAASRVVSSQ